MSDYKLVPVEPTDEMVSEGARHLRIMSIPAREAASVYKAMLAAAPAINIVATKNEQGQIVSVTLKDEDHRILEVIAEADVQGEPVGWQFYKDGKWWHGSDCIKGHRKNAEEAGYLTRDVYASPQPAGSALPPEITREMLGMIIDEVFGGGIEDASVIEDIYRVIARSATMQPAEQQPAPDVAGLVEALESLLRHAKKMGRTSALYDK